MARPTFAEELCRSAIRRCEEQLGNGRNFTGFWFGGIRILSYQRIGVLGVLVLKVWDSGSWWLGLWPGALIFLGGQAEGVQPRFRRKGLMGDRGSTHTP